MESFIGSFGGRLQMLSVQLVPFIMAVVFHEFAHGFIAHHWGDPTAKNAGRLTLNPVPHISPVGTLLLPMMNMLFGLHFLIGWAKPVPIDPTLFRKYRPGLFWVSIAGPLTNFILAIFSAALFCGMRKWGSPEFYLYEPLLAMSYVSIYLNYMLGIFNLIPLPPLDGSKVVQSFLSLPATLQYEKLARYSFFILMALLFTGALGVVMGPIRLIADMTLGLMAVAFGLPTT